MTENIIRKTQTGEPGNPGEFGTKPKNEPATGLPAPASAEAEAERERLATILADASLSREDLESFDGYAGFDYAEEVHGVSDAVVEHYYGAEGTDNMSVTLAYDGEGIPDGIEITVRPEGHRYSISQFVELKHIGDRDATGLDSAVSVAADVEGHVQRLISDARKMGPGINAAAKEPMSRDEALSKADENGRVTSVVAVPLDEFLSRGETDAEFDSDSSRPDYLAQQQMEDGFPYDLSYTLKGVYGDQAIVEVSNFMEPNQD